MGKWISCNPAKCIFTESLELEGTLNSAISRDAYSSTRHSESHPVLSFYEVKGKNPSHMNKMAIGDFRRDSEVIIEDHVSTSKLWAKE